MDAEVNISDRSAAKSSSLVTVKPVVNAVRILRFLSQAAAPERSVDIARKLDINPSTCFNILRTLVAEDMVDFSPMSKRYSAGLGLARLVEQFVTQGQKVQLAKPLLEKFAARSKVTVTLWRRIGNDRIVIVSSAACPTDVRIDMSEGQRLPILMGASGRLFASQLDLDQPQPKAIFDNIRWSGALSYEEYCEQVRDAAKLGWSIDDGHFSIGILAVAAPVYSPSETIDFTVSAVMFRGQRDEAGIAELGQSLRNLGKELGSVLF
ncbi:MULTISPECIES: IclR family transcriptional regulator [Halopseudomonas]|uniref:HTH-type transcriptional repressor AllR n=1 Tax=Halopseudomonas pelagia TaxID=553151 RepID=A0AA91U2G7_9GAMM|nr:IclR family transcriptional regulator [Halopseudomonas pelagia]MBQ0741845.1 IclR family transcriptional regulator [Pseudomonas sp.]WOD10033.1 IclR family transcriptional regulator [Pseudomonas sp. NyZ704]MBQ0776209.1 IclR family transcriptional regulator [Pseudomonas sp.]PCC99533.1 IclR family transcriptional regulator [Halopseudomonas pelagia]QFY56528.1 IclR family transcriptional regulator [Halopseudomonas pelagia]